MRLINPLFRRYTRSQIRPVSAGIKAATLLVFTTFLFLFTYLFCTRSLEFDPIVGARIALIPVFSMQCLVLLIAGTAATTLGYAREVNDGMADYQRLTPLSPLGKTLGYLFGLPVLHYLLVLLLMPLVIFCCIRGEISAGMAGDVYLLLLSSAILYHLTGIIAGTVLKRRLFASLLSMVIVICINIILPYFFRQAGYQFLFHLTVWPVLQQHGLELVAESAVLLGEPLPKKDLLAFRELFGSVPFFGQQLPVLLFSILVQGTLSLSFILILVRRWRDAEHHLLSKAGSVVLCLWILFLFLGSALPLIQSGDIFPSQLSARMSLISGGKITFFEGYLLSGVCGLVTLLFSLMLIGSITPRRNKSLTGMRRAVKAKRKRAPFWSDEAGSLPLALLIGLLGGGAWIAFSVHVFGYILGSDWLEKWPLPPPLMMIAFCLSCLCAWGAIANGGKKLLWLGLFFLWIVPMMIGAILTVLSMTTAGNFVAGLSGFTALFSALSAGFTTVKAFQGFGSEELAQSFPIWVVMHLLIFVGLLLLYRRDVQKMRQQAKGETV